MLTWLKFPAGSPYVMAANWVDQSGAPYGLTGAVLTGYLYATFADSLDSDNALATLSHAQAGYSSSTLTFTAAATSTWKATAAPYYRATVSVGGVVTREIIGRLWLSPIVPAPQLEPDDTLLIDTALMTVATLTVSAPINLPLITGYVGAATTDLDAVPTASYSTGTIVILSISGVAQWWQLQASPPAASTEAPYTCVQPTDYHATTNPRRWVLL